MDPAAEPPPPAPGPGAAAATTTRWMLPKLPLLIGAIGIGAAVSGGSWFKHRADLRHRAEIGAIRAEVALLQSDAGQYRARFANLQWNADKFHAAAGASPDERTNAWARERARCFDALVARIDRSADEGIFAKLANEIEAACARGDVKTARARLLEIPEVSFPSAGRFRELQAETYFKPLAAVSRTTPAYYRAFQQFEPEAAKADIAALRQELAGTNLETVTPQSMLKLELFSAVAPPDDPLVADASVLATAADYFDEPSPATLASWRRAQQAVRLEDWPTAVAQMQSILRTTVRTRLPFRAAYARTVLKNRPEDKATAYPFMQEAAAAGDAGARAWMVDEELAQGRPAQAARWLEVAVEAGEAEAVRKLLELYAKPREASPRDLAREAGVLQKIVVAPDAPPLALLLLARLYEEGRGIEASASEAFACYRRAAKQNYLPAWVPLARCFLRGQGTPADADQARDWAARAFAAGERTESVPLLVELMRTAPERTASAVQELIEHEQIAGAAGFADVRTYGPSMAQLQMELARYLDQHGLYGQAARYYAKSGSRDPAIMRRRATLTAVHPCETCGGAGKVRTSAPCPTCGGKGTVTCHVCDGRGYHFVPGAPPCPTCNGSGTMVQDGRVLTCAACSGTGKGKGSVIRKVCTACTRGREPCHDCTGGRITLSKECPDCHGTGSRALADQ